MKDLDIPGSARAAAWWKPKANNLFTILYLTLYVASVPFEKVPRLLVLSAITILGLGSFGHCINDRFDIESDRRGGKPNRFARLTLRRQYLALGTALAAGLLPWLLLPRDRTSALLLALEVLLLTSYAIPPVRLKSRMYLAILCDAAYAYGVPSILAARTVFLVTPEFKSALFICALFLWQMFLGIRHYLNHIARDRSSDLAAGAPTLATIKGNYHLHGISRTVILPLEIISFGILLVSVTRFGVFPVVACAALFLALSSLPLALAIARPYSLLTHSFRGGAVDVFYQTLLPFVFIASLGRKDPRFLLLPVFQLLPLLPRSLSPAPGRRIWARWSGYWPLRILSSSALTLTASDTQTENPPTGLARSRNPAALNVAVANINRAKYTETFINEALPRLKFNVYYLYGGELPVYDDDHRHVLSGEIILHNLAQLIESLFRLDRGHFARNSIANYLQRTRIRMVLAEFGPVGVQLLPITRDLGIPLIVYFHGYDVFHEPTWKAHATSYARLFREAEKILVVSRLMGERLLKSGAPGEKIVHLPAFVNLELFPYRDHSGLPPRFIAVGRFAETKSPHLTILAFKRVVEAFPEATLTMIGKGGGGELFEACLILTKALGLEGRTFFRGVASHEEVASQMANARVFVQHSVTTPENHDREGKPVAIMEAMACGLPVIATRHSGIAELITDRQDGILVDEYDIEAMASAMIRLAADDPLVRTLGERASRRIHSDPLIRDHIRILEEIIDRCAG